MESRKYFDYELAYEGFKEAKKIFNKGGLKALIEDSRFVIGNGGGTDYVGTIDQWADNGYIPIIASAYNITIYVNDKNYDTNKKNHEWYLSNNIVVISYSGGSDSLYITDIDELEFRINDLKRYAKNNDYTQEDIDNELSSLNSVLSELKGKVFTTNYRVLNSVLNESNVRKEVETK